MQRTRHFPGEDEDGYEDDDTPLHHKRPFGAGLKRKRVEFVRASQPDQGVASTATGTKPPATAIGDLYASIVLHKESATAQIPGADADADAMDLTPDDEYVPDEELCQVCGLAPSTTSQPHEASIAHQVSLAHSHPPSALDRSRMGLKALKAQGWDPDARQGLGRDGDGIMYPIKLAAKDDNLGVGATIPQGVLPKQEEKPRSLSRKELRHLAEVERVRNQRLQGEIFGSVDVERYLRGDGSDR